MKTNYFSVLLDGLSLGLASDFRDGEDDLIFFLHGLGCSRASFRPFWDYTDFAHYSAIAIDFVGFGESSKPIEFSYAMEDQARVSAEILKQFSSKRLHLVTHSMGCAIALLLPAEILNSAKTFTSIEGNLIGADCGEVSRRVISTSFQVFKAEVFPQIREQLDNIGEGYYAMGSTDANALYKSAQSLVSWSDSNQLLEKFLSLEVNKKYFYGDSNAGHPTIERLGDMPKIGIADSGHFPMMDNPCDFYSELYKFISEREK